MENSNNLRLDHNKDDNNEIIKLLNDRMALGRERYGHGVIVNDDTTKYGTPTNDWEMMAMEEILDGMIYMAASMIRLQRKRKSITQAQ